MERKDVLYNWCRAFSAVSSKEWPGVVSPGPQFLGSSQVDKDVVGGGGTASQVLLAGNWSWNGVKDFTSLLNVTWVPWVTLPLFYLHITFKSILLCRFSFTLYCCSCYTLHFIHQPKNAGCGRWTKDMM